MQNYDIAQRIKELCKQNQITVTNLLAECTLSKSFIYDLEKRSTSPSCEKIIKIANFFNVSVDFILCLTDINANNGDVPKISYKTNELSNDDIKQVQSYIDFLLFNKRKETIAHIEETPKKAIEMPIKEVTEPAEVVSLPEYLLPVSAGIGNYMSDTSDYEVREYPLTAKSQKADFVIITDGDSMNPTIKDKEKLFIKSQPTIESGEVGIFVYNNDAYCKRLFIDYQNKHIILRSDNKKYKDIVITNEDSLKTIGKVLF